MNRRSTITDAASGVTTFGYNLAGQLTSIRDPENNDTTYARDLLGRVTQEENELGHSRYFVYDAASNLTAKKDRNARLTAYSFDDLDRLTSENWLSGTTSLPSLAVATTTQGGPVNEVQRVGMTVSMAFTGGTFTLSFGGQTTSGIAYNASAATVQTALEALSSIGSGNIAVTKSQNTTTAQEWTLTFQGSLAGADQSQVTINSSGVMGFMTVSNIQATDTNGNSGVNEVQTVTLSNATAGTFRLAFGNESTGPIAYNASASTIDSALESLSTIGSGNVSVSGSAGGPYTITFQGSMAGINQPSLQGDASHATSGSVARTKGYVFDDASQLLSETDGLGRQTDYTYDDLGRMVQQVLPDPDGVGGVGRSTYSWVFDAGSNLVASVDALSNQTTYDYDHLNRLISTTNPLSGTRSYVYNAGSQLTSETDEMGATTSYTFDAIGNLTGKALSDPDGVGPLSAPTWSYSFDQMSRRISETNPLSETTSYAYDAVSRVTSITDANSGVTSFTFDAAGNRLTLTDPEGNTTQWYFDGANRVTQEKDARNESRYFVYDNEDNLIERTDRNGRVTKWEYDLFDNPLTEKWMSGATALHTITYAYNNADQLTAASDSFVSFAFAYDGMGRETSVDNYGTPNQPHVVLASAYDANSNRTSVAATVNSTLDFKNDYTFDDLGQLTQVKQHGQSGGNTVADKRVDLAYNAVGQYDTVERFADLSGTDLVVTSSYSYDDIHRLLGLSHDKGATTLAGYDYTFDAGSRVASVDSLLDGLSSYTYDVTNQLMAVDHATIADEAHTWDSNGNRDGGSDTVGTDNRLTSDGTYDYEYDDEGNRTKKTTIATGAYVTYAWDYRNRLTTVAFYNASHVLQKKIEYDYDVFDRRMAKRVDANGDGTFDSAQKFVYDGEDIVLVYDAGGSLTNRYLHGAGPDEVFADERFVSGVLDDVYYPLGDHLGTARDFAVYDAGLDDTSIAKHLTLDSLGRIVADSASSLPLLYAFTGREWDADAQLYYYRARWYDPAIGQFISKDPIGFLAGDANTLRYVGNDFTNATDPSGLAERIDVEGGGVILVHKGGGISVYIESSTGHTPNPVELAIINYERTGRIPAYSPALEYTIRTGLFPRVYWDVHHPEQARRFGNSFAVSGVAAMSVAGQSPSLAPVAAPIGTVRQRQFNPGLPQPAVVSRPGIAPGSGSGGASSSGSGPGGSNSFRLPVGNTGTGSGSGTASGSSPASASTAQSNTVTVFSATSRPVDLARPGTGAIAPGGTLTARGAGGTFVTKVDLTNPKTFQDHIDFNVPPGRRVDHVTEIRVPPAGLKVDPTEAKLIPSNGWIAPQTPGAEVVRSFKVEWVPDPGGRGFDVPRIVEIELPAGGK